MTSEQDLWDKIAIVITLDSLYEDFDTTTTNLLEAGGNIINQIQSILKSKKGKNISKQAIGGGIGDCAMIFREKNAPKGKANSNNECYNCHKLGHFERDYSLSDKKLNKNIQQFWRKDEVMKEKLTERLRRRTK